MARYKVLKSVAHNFAHSFVSLMNYNGGDYVNSHLTRAVQGIESGEIRSDLLRRTVEPSPLLIEPVAGAIDSYVADFGRFVTQGGAALDTLNQAHFRVRVERRPVIGKGAGEIVAALITAEVTLRDDRGRSHVGESRTPWSCEGAV